jgi:metal-responsive CopG/Arc/MetJ family transcriptional regulator
MHSHVARERCVTVYIVEGEANRIREFATEFRKIKDVEMVMPIYTDGTA